MPRVLVDTCAREHGVLLGHSFGVPTSTTWGTQVVSHDVPYLQRRQRASTELWLREQTKHLAAVTAAMAAGHLEAFTTPSLTMEDPHKAGWAHGSHSDLWKDVTFKHVDPPLERSTLMGDLTFAQSFESEHQHAFCKFLLDLERTGLPLAWIDALNLDEFQLANLARLGEFRGLCEAVGETRWRDAFHYWTTICNGLDYFLTTDQAFLRMLRERCDGTGTEFELHRRAVCPSDLVEILDLPAAPLPFQEGEYIALFDSLRD